MRGALRSFKIFTILACIKDSDCQDHLTCGDIEECIVPPCQLDCVTNAHCEVKNHIITGICICNIGYAGDPYREGCQMSLLGGKESQFLQIHARAGERSEPGRT